MDGDPETQKGKTKGPNNSASINQRNRTEVVASILREHTNIIFVLGVSSAGVPPDLVQSPFAKNGDSLLMVWLFIKKHF